MADGIIETLFAMFVKALSVNTAHVDALLRKTRLRPGVTLCRKTWAVQERHGAARSTVAFVAGSTLSRS